MDKHATHCLIHLIIIYSWHSRHNKPLQASVRAVTSGTLWALKREDFRGILMSEFSNIPSLKLLRSVELFTRFTVLQLSQLAESLVEVSFADGQKIVDKVLGVGKQLLDISFSYALFCYQPANNKFSHIYHFFRMMTSLRYMSFKEVV